MFLKKLIKQFLIKHFDFIYYGAYHNQVKFIEILKYFFSRKKKIIFNNTVITFPIKSFFVYHFFKDNAALRDGDFEKKNIMLYKSIVNNFNILIDVGANIGFYSMLFSSKTRNLSYAIELNPMTFYHLNLITRKNKNIKTYNLAITDKNSFIDYPKFQPVKMSLKLNNKSYLDLGSITIPTQTIDSFLKKNLLEKKTDTSNLFLKIDIEGEETNLFKDSDLLIKEIKPFILLELHSPKFIKLEDSVNILKYLDDNSYECYDVNQGLKYIEIKEYNNEKFLLCVPKDKKDKLNKIKKEIL
jgi:FkbM family methyltransferase